MKSKVIVKVGIFSAMSFILQLLVPYKVSGFLDIEFSDIPATIITFAVGPVAAVLVELIKNLLHLLVSSTSGIGEFANFVVTSTFVLVSGTIYKLNKSKANALISLIIATISFVIIGFFVNLYVMLPLYMPGRELKAKLDILLYTIVPFNIAKGTILSAITFLTYKKISGILK